MVDIDTLSSSVYKTDVLESFGALFQSPEIESYIWEKILLQISFQKCSVTCATRDMFFSQKCKKQNLFCKMLTDKVQPQEIEEELQMFKQDLFS